MTRLAVAAVALLVIAQIAVYSPRALPSMILAAVVVAAVVVVEEGRVSSARSGEKSAKKRVCHHGGTSFQPFDGDEKSRGRS
jgi:hypothetical protein